MSLKLKIRNPLEELYTGIISDNSLKKNLNIIVWAAAVGTVCFSITGGTPMTGYAKVLNASDFEFGLLWAFPVIASLVQFLASMILEKTRMPKIIFLISGVIQRFVWFIAAILPFIVPDAFAQSRIYFLIMISTMSSVAGAFVNITFYSFFSAMVPLEIRGRYISFRTALCTIFSVLGGLSSAFLLDHLPGYMGFTIVFTIASLFGMADILMFLPAKFHDYKSDKTRVSFFSDIKIIVKDKKIRDYLIFWCVFNFGINLASSFFGRYAINEKNVLFSQMIIFGQIPCNIISIFMLPRWGRLLDRFGSKVVLFFSIICNSLLVWIWLPPIPCIVTVFIFNTVGGFIWCATDITSQSMLISHTPENKRSVVIAFYFVVTSLSSALAFVIAGSFLEFTQDFFIRLTSSVFGSPVSNYKILFAIASLVRLSAAVFFVPKLWNEKEFTIKSAFNKIISELKEKHK